MPLAGGGCRGVEASDDFADEDEVEDLEDDDASEDLLVEGFSEEAALPAAAGAAPSVTCDRIFSIVLLPTPAFARSSSEA